MKEKETDRPSRSCFFVIGSINSVGLLTNFKAASASSSSLNFQSAASLSTSRTFINVTESCTGLCIRGIARYRSQARNRCPFNTRLPCCALKSLIPRKCMKARGIFRFILSVSFGRPSLCRFLLASDHQRITTCQSLNAFPRRGGPKMKTRRRRFKSEE